MYQVSIPMFGAISGRVYTRVYYCTGALHLVEFVTLVLYIIQSRPHVHSCDAHEKLKKIGTKNSF